MRNKQSAPASKFVCVPRNPEARSLWISLGLDSRVCDDLAPFRDFGDKEFSKFGFTPAERLDANRAEALTCLGLCKHSIGISVDLRRHRRRHASRTEQRIPCVERKARHTRFTHRRNIGYKL